MAPTTTQEAATEGTSSARTCARRASLLVLIYFALLVGVVPVAQLVTELVRREPIQELDVFRKFPTLERLQK